MRHMPAMAALCVYFVHVVVLWRSFYLLSSLFAFSMTITHESTKYNSTMLPISGT